VNRDAPAGWIAFHRAGGSRRVYGEYVSSSKKVMLVGCNQLTTNTKILVFKLIKEANKINVCS